MSLLSLLLNPKPVEVPRPVVVKPAPEPKDDARRVAAKLRFKNAMGDRWLHIKEIERLARVSRATAFRNLRRYLATGIVERRPFGGGEYCTNIGYEWRWKK